MPTPPLIEPVTEAERVLAVPGVKVMGILNVTPDSFSDGGRHYDPESAFAQAARMHAEGAAIIDVGGESTRPGSDPVAAAEEVDRVVPVIERIRAELPAVISVDTSKPEVMRAAISAGAGLVNDVRALRLPGALEAAAALEVPVVLMHMLGEPRTMQHAPSYHDVVKEVKAFLVARAEACAGAGIARERVLVDPGFGFGKTLDHNLTLLARLDVLVAAGYPVVVGVSRKSMFKALLGRGIADRLAGGLAVAVMAATKGVAVIRTHDVAPTVDALRVVAALVARDG